MEYPQGGLFLIILINLIEYIILIICNATDSTLRYNNLFYIMHYSNLY